MVETLANEATPTSFLSILIISISTSLFLNWSYKIRIPNIFWYIFRNWSSEYRNFNIFEIRVTNYLELLSVASKIKLKLTWLFLQNRITEECQKNADCAIFIAGHLKPILLAGY